MMGRLNHDQQQLFYSFHLDEAVPHDHPVREIASVLDLSWVHSELAPFYPKMERPSIDPELMIRMLIIGYVFAIRSERAICRDLRVNLAYRWFCGLSIARTKSQITRYFHAPVMSASGKAICSGGCLSVLLRPALPVCTENSSVLI
jgi:transposase